MRFWFGTTTTAAECATVTAKEGNAAALAKTKLKQEAGWFKLIAPKFCVKSADAIAAKEHEEAAGD